MWSPQPVPAPAAPRRALFAAALLAACMAGAGAGATELAVTAATPAAMAVDADRPELVVCADPSSLPYSNTRGEGFENHIAQIVADDLHARLRFEWNEQRRGYLRRGLNAHGCDLLLDVPVGLEGVHTLAPLWRSSYVFVTRRGLRIEGFDDPRLRTLRIGLQAIGIEGINTPPAASVALRGLSDRVTGYASHEAADYSAAELVAGVAAGDVDVGVLWGPQAGWFARAHPAALDITPVVADPKLPEIAYTYAMAPAVRRGDDAFGDRVQKALDRHAAEIRTLVASYGVPLVEAAATAQASAPPATP